MGYNGELNWKILSVADNSLETYTFSYLGNCKRKNVVLFSVEELQKYTDRSTIKLFSFTYNNDTLTYLKFQDFQIHLENERSYTILKMHVIKFIRFLLGYSSIERTITNNSFDCVSLVHFGLVIRMWGSKSLYKIFRLRNM